ncbi:S8 family serine peptidase [Novosphingobium mangrovi (ex Huang et al. 2023)]|uniref:S8 family serine peptidase n=1 Tax=Novosphingobium mangrovi (ex Huang et al. 2023) TaxID=2976432 RepID=A0ABT2I4F2_9SPHN|nr:S8 family serine peptidase [Novosphingobium mangrovi (ex Huang et al. 2023)]MCT2399679.1 S8 family serine peptidase [Novosphingobium mangrovi (ex Huang et al. 2023)]
MKIKLMATLACSTAALVAAGPALAKSGDIIPNSYICVFNKKAVNTGGVQSEAHRAAAAAGGKVTHLYRYTIHGFSTNMSAQAASQMKARNPSIAYCEPDRVIELAPPIEAQKGKPGSGGGGSTGQQTPWGIARVNGGVSGVGKRAWIIDTGIDSTHPDLTVDASLGNGFVTREEGLTEDLNGHGTHVSGTIAAKNNSIGVIGVAAGATVIPVRVLNRRGSGSYAGVIAGVDWVGQHGQAGDVANMSLGGPTDDALDAAVLAASSVVKFAIAAGNSGANANDYSPARVNGPNVYTVSAFSDGDKWASFSNYGNPPIDYAEPGVSILSTWRDGGYNTISGTSMATPHLAGLLLVGFSADGTVSGDPDGHPDTIGAH